MKIIKKHKWIFLIVLLTIIITLIFFIPINKKVSFELKDRCGPIMNMISHTIKDEFACRSQCRSQCGVKDLKFSKVIFSLNEIGCNNCTCLCK